MHLGEEVCVVRLEGSLHATEVPEVDALVGALEDAPDRSLVVDASLLSEIDDAGVDCLAHLQETVGGRGGRMCVYAASGAVARALDGLLGRYGHGPAQRLA
jgi:anti-anti-sigma factor